MNKKRIVLWLLLAAWMSLIFSMSAMEAPASEGLSVGLTEKVIRVVVPHYDTMTPEQQKTALDQANHTVRKLGHASEFAVLGILAGLALLSYQKKLRFQVLVSLLICAAYAVSDELHQILVSGRSPQATDVLIDIGGSVLGIVLIVLIIKTREKRNLKRKLSAIKAG